MSARITALVLMAAMLSAPAFAYTISGTIPPSSPPKPVTIDLHKPLKAGNITFTFGAPRVNAGVGYVLAYCVGPAEDPCTSPLSHAIEVPAGETRTLTIDALVFSCNVLTVGQGTRVAVPYSVEVTQP